MKSKLPQDPIALFSSYMGMVDVPRLEKDAGDDPSLAGKTLGLVNGSAWIQLWSYYFGRKHLPGVKLVNIGNEAIQLNFMKAHRDGKSCPPESNVRLFADYARQLVDLAQVDAVMVTCSTMNRSLAAVKAAVPEVPVVQIDEPMMEKAVEDGGTILVVATHGPTVASTTALLKETAVRMGRREPNFRGATVEEAFHLLGTGDLRGHNRLIAEAIAAERARGPVDRVVLAQLSMGVFVMEHPDCEKEIDIPVLCSGDEGFKHMRRILSALH